MSGLRYLVVLLLPVLQVAGGERSFVWRFEGADANPVELEKGARIVTEQGRGGSLRLDSPRARAVARDVTGLPDLAADRPFTAVVRVRPDAGVISGPKAALAKMVGSVRVAKLVEALRDGRWHMLALVFDPAQEGREYALYFDWDDPKSPYRFVATRPKAEGASFSLPLVVRGTTVTFGGPIRWGSFSLDYRGLIDDVVLLDRAVRGDGLLNLVEGRSPAKP